VTTPRDRASKILRGWQAAAFALAGTARRRIAARRGQVCVLMYHRVLADDASADGIEPGMYVRAATFAAHLRWLGDHFRFVSLRDVQAPPDDADDAPRVALTFDDGWRDNLTHAWPLLAAAGAPATIFLATDWIADGGGDGSFLAPDDVRRMAAAGIDFGAHTGGHPRLTGLGDEAVRDELIRSKRAVEEWTRRPCSLFAYPYGDCDDRVARLAGEQFELCAAIANRWWTPGGDRTRVSRVGVHEDMSSTPRRLAALLALRA